MDPLYIFKSCEDFIATLVCIFKVLFVTVSRTEGQLQERETILITMNMYNTLVAKSMYVLGPTCATTVPIHTVVRCGHSKGKTTCTSTYIHR